MLFSNLSISDISSKGNAGSKTKVICNNMASRDRDGGCIQHFAGCNNDQKSENGFRIFNPATRRNRFSKRQGRVSKISRVNKINQYGNDGADNSSNKFKISSPLNDSYQKSIYIAVLESYFGWRGIVSPVMMEYKGEKYDFDFYYPNKGKLVKVFRTLDSKEIDRYAPLSNYQNVLFILDARDLVLRCENYADNINNLSPGGLEAAIALKAAVFFDSRIWAPKDDPAPGDFWEEEIPIFWDRGYDAAMEDMNKVNDDEG